MSVRHHPEEAKRQLAGIYWRHQHVYEFKMRQLALLSVASLTVAASACMWDYDTFAVEARGKDDLVAVLAGRFERNPPLYYEMRLKHGLEELRREPNHLGQYDNSAVAAERLGNHDQALQIISEKKRHLKPLPADKDGWYRYFANIGTFHAHRSFSQKDPRKRLEDLKLSEAEIAKSIEINPEAHFGREKYQLYAIRWIMEGVPKNEPFWVYLRDKELVPSGQTDAAITGLSGLIRLGGAWESVDIWATLAVLLGQRGHASLKYYALDRVEELENDGKKSLIELPWMEGETQHKTTLRKMAEKGSVYPPSEDLRAKNKVIYADLRAQAEKWHDNRTAYMMERLNQGHHPDWDKDFWAQWDDEPQLEVTTPPLWDQISPGTKITVAIAIALVTLVASPFVLFFIGRRWWRRHKGGVVS